MISLEQISVKDFYKQTSKKEVYGVQEYVAPKKYFDPLAAIKQKQLQSGVAKPKKKQTKRGSYLEDEAKIHKFKLGPGKYPNEDLWPKKTRSLMKPTKKLTCFEELIKKQKKQKRPGPSHYQIGKTLKQLDAQRKALARKKIRSVDRMSFLDSIQFQATTVPGVGNYNPRKRAKTQMGMTRLKPQDWKKKHIQLAKKKPPKTPDMGTYNPQSMEFNLFSSIKKQTNSKKSYLGKLERFKTWSEKFNIGPGKYVKFHQWRGKEVKPSRQRYGLDAVSKGLSKSLYYH